MRRCAVSPPRSLLSHLPAGFRILGVLAQGRRHVPRTRVVRIAGQLLLQAGGEFVQSVRMLFHSPMVARRRGRGDAIVSGGVS